MNSTRAAIAALGAAHAARRAPRPHTWYTVTLADALTERGWTGDPSTVREAYEGADDGVSPARFAELLEASGWEYR